MSANFPSGFKVDEIQREIYPHLEARMMPLIKRKAAKLARYVKLEDAIQEGRLTLLYAMTRFDYNRGAEKLEEFVGTCLDHRFTSLYHHATTQSRMPRMSVRADQEGWVQVKRAPVSLEDVNPSGDPFDPPDHAETPEEELSREELENQAKVFHMKMMGRLKGRDRDVFMCKTHPTPELLTMIRNMEQDWREGPTNEHVAQFLGLTKNQVDYSLTEIRDQFARLGSGTQFSDLFGDRCKRGWGMVHVSAEPHHDVTFIQRVIASRKLDPCPTPGTSRRDDYCQHADGFMRQIERYPWGVVVVLQRGKEWQTLVIEGRFRPSTGEITGANGGRRSIPVEWYGQLVKALRNASLKGQES